MSERRFVVFAVVLLFFTIPGVSLANPQNYTTEDLPDFCNYVQLSPGHGSPTSDYYYSVYGKTTFHHMHHYCWALFFYNEGLQIRDDPNFKRYTWQEAIANFDYVLKRTDSTFVLRPEILVRKGSALLFMKDRVPEGLTCLKQAIDLREDFVPAYVAMGNYFARAGDTDEARRILRAGLARAPDTDLLKRKLSELADPVDAEGR